MTPKKDPSTKGSKSKSKTSPTSSKDKEAKGATAGARAAEADGHLHDLIDDLRGALDELVLQIELAGMEGRDALHRRADEVEARWATITRDIGYRRIDVNAGVEAVKTAFTRAEETLRSLLDPPDPT